MTDPIVTEQRKMLDPVQAGEDEGARTDRWSSRLVLFLRVMAALALLKGLYHWAIVCGFLSPSDATFEDSATPVQSATVFFGVIDLVAAVGLWLAAPWGAVVWLTSVISMVVDPAAAGAAARRLNRPLSSSKPVTTRMRGMFRTGFFLSAA